LNILGAVLGVLFETLVADLFVRFKLQERFVEGDEKNFRCEERSGLNESADFGIFQDDWHQFHVKPQVKDSPDGRIDSSLKRLSWSLHNFS
jgi:hypothetical protein